MQRRRVAKLVLALSIMGGISAIADPASAITKHECEEAGGIFVKGAAGINTCVFPTSPPPEQAEAQKEDRTTGRANTGSNQDQEEENCIVNRGGTHC